MKKTLTYLALSLMATAGAMAAPISPEQALDRLQNSDGELLLAPKTRADISPRLQYTFKANDGKASLYVFENGAEGYMIVSADDLAMPLLGYSDDNKFDPNNIPPGLQYWLNEYTRQIEYARSQPATRALDTRSITLPSWSPIQPLLKTKWDQGNPYNLLCPKDGNRLSYTGCVATSMAQAMKFFNYPAKGQGSISYQAKYLGRTLSMVFSDVTFDWNNMLDTYTDNKYNEAQATAVATLMKACGYAVQMDYSSYESGAVSGGIGKAMVTYFDYDKGVKYYNRAMYTYTQWATMLYNNIKNVGPVIYDGTGSGGGHSFILDGYSGNGYFHFNWGWSGMSDGYYVIDALDPASLGAGGGAGGFNYDQGALFDLQPNQNGATQQQNNLILYGNLTGSVSGGALTLLPTSESVAGWAYQGLGSMQAQIGVEFVNTQNPSAAKINAATNSGYTNFNATTYLPPEARIQVQLNGLSLEANVKYKVINTYRVQGGEWQEVPAAVGYHNYFYLTKTTTGRYTVENVDPEEFSATGITFDTQLYFNNAVKFTANITNPNDIELTRSLALILVNSSGNIAFIGDSYLVSLSPGGSSSQTWTTALTKKSGSNVTSATQFYPGLYDTENNVVCYQSTTPVTMEPNPGTPSITVKNIEVVGAPVKSSNGGTTVYDVNNAAEFTVQCDINVTKGYMFMPVILGVFAPTDDGTGDLELYNTYSYGYVLLNAGETETIQIPVQFPDAEVGTTYGISMLTSSGGGLTWLAGNVLTAGFYVSGIGEAGIESIITESGEITFLIDRGSSSVIAAGDIVNVEAYMLNGMKAPVQVEYNNGVAVADLSALGKGVVVVTATDRQGNRKSTKIAL